MCIHMAKILGTPLTWIKNISWVSYELIKVTSSEIILSHFESILWYFSHTFHYSTDEISGKYKKTCQSGKWMSHPSHLCVLRPYHVNYMHHVSYMCGCALRFDTGDVWKCIYPFHICEVLAANHMQMRLLSHTWSGWEVLWEVHCPIRLFSQKVWEKMHTYQRSFPIVHIT